MMRKSPFSIFVVMLALAGCAAPGPKEEEPQAPAEVEEPAAPGPTATPEPTAPAEPTAGPGAEAAGVEGPGAFEGHPLDDPDSPLANRTIYFDFDDATVKSQYHDLLDRHAQFLSEHPEQKVTLEGHTDERGSREYNIGLGERRAKAVRRLLLFQGAREDQIRTVSYGEEKPVAEGHNEEAWSKNRRVEMVYPGHNL